MRRKTPLRARQASTLRSKPLTRNTALKKRRQSRQQTERVYGSAAFRAWLHLTPCLWCMVTRPIEQAHFGKHAMGKKNDWRSTGPLCGPFMVGSVAYAGCHARLDRREMTPGTKWFTATERKMLATLQAAFIAEWDARGGTLVEQFVPSSGDEA